MKTDQIEKATHLSERLSGALQQAHADACHEDSPASRLLAMHLLNLIQDARQLENRINAVLDAVKH